MPITVTFAKYSGTETKIGLTAGNDGAFSFCITPEEAGQWTVSVTCSGATYSLQSVELPLVVVERQDTVNPDTTHPETEEPTNGQNVSFPVEQLLVLVAVLVVVVAVFVYIGTKKRKISSPVAIH